MGLPRRVRIGPKPGKLCVEGPRIDNKAPKDWDTLYELVVSFQYGLDEDAISRAAGLRNYDTGVMLATMRRDLMFPCGTDPKMAYDAAKRLRAVDHFGVLELRISHPVEKLGKDSWTVWYNPEGKLIDAIKHREYRTITTKVPGGFKLTRVPLRGKGKAA